MTNKNISQFIPMNLQKSREFIESESKLDINKKWLMYSPEIVAIIDQYVDEGNYPYNRDIEDLTASKLFPDIDGDNERLFSLIVYNSQQFRRARIEQERIGKLYADGYLMANAVSLEQHKDHKWFSVVLTGQNILGFDVEKTQRMKLLKTCDNRFFWMKPRARSRGILANQQFFKPI